MATTTAAPRTYLDRAGLLAIPDRIVEELHVPEWSAWVRVASWDGATRWRIIQLWPREGGRADNNLLALVASVSLVNEAGARLFTDADVAALALKNARALDRIFTVALRLNGLSEGAVDALGKDSAPSPNGGSTSPSPPNSG